MEKKNAYLKKIKADLDNISKEIEILKNDLKKQGIELTKTEQKKIFDLEEKYENVKQSFIALKSAHKESWLDLKNGFEKAWLDLKKALKSILQQFKK